MKKAIRAGSALAALAVLLLGSCSRGGWGIAPRAREHALRVLIPAAPPAWAAFPGLRVSLTWRDSSGERREAIGEPGRAVRIELGRGFPQAILARPALAGESLLPAGAIYPDALAGAGADPEELALDWAGGYAACLFLALERGGVDPSGFDLDTLARKGAERSGDPWLVDPQEVARRLAEGSFRIDLFRMPERFALALPGPGPWAPESPFAPAPEGAGFEVRLPAGLWRYVGEGRELFASVDEKGRAAFAER